MGSLLCCIPELLTLLTKRIWASGKQVETENSKVALCKPLPQELVADILSRLPADSLYHCAKAYRDWNSFFSTHYFIHDLFLPRASPTIIVHHRPLIDDELYYIDDFKGDGNITPISFKIKDDPCICSCFDLDFSCFGLLFFTHRYLSYAIVFNPVTCEKTFLVHDCGDYTNICGVYYHPIAKEFCVLLVSRFVACNYVKFKLLREQGPSRIWNTLSRISYLPVTRVPPVNLNGALHWMRRDWTGSHSIILFSIVEEEFKLMSDPLVDPERKQKREKHLFDLNGNLALCHIVDELEIWTLENYTSWFWTKTHSIKLGGLDHLRSISARVLGTQDGALIVHVSGKGTFACYLQQKTSNNLIFHEFKVSRRAKYVCLHTKSLISFRAFQPSPKKYQQLHGKVLKCKLRDEVTRPWMEASIKAAQRRCKDYFE